jgi:hypothetical protein
VIFKVVVYLVMSVGLDRSVQKLVIPDLADEPVFVSRVLVSNQSSSSERRSFVQGEFLGAAHPAAADLAGPVGSFGGSGPGEIGVLRREVQEHHDGVGQLLPVDILFRAR